MRHADSLTLHGSLEPVTNYPIVALPPKIFSGKARGERFGYSN
jgi:hypothetical protein